jgi:hypothetical protein
METLNKYYRWSFIFAIVALFAGAGIGWQQGGLPSALSVALTVAILAVLETSLSFDNAVVNAKILSNWDHRWQQIFLTWGIWIAVFGMRIVFPIAIVSVATGIAPFYFPGWFGMDQNVLSLALFAPEQYAEQLRSVHHEVAGFGGAFLFMVAFGFFFAEKHVYWLEAIETRLTKLGQIEGVSAALTLIILLVVSKLFDNAEEGTQFFISGVWGVVTFILAHGLGSVLGGEGDETGEKIVRAGLAGFLYLEILDASFSFDGVIGAFVLTNYLPVIALGLGVGAFFVRSMTIHLVENGTLAEYRYLEHGAFYAIFALAVLMFGSGVGYELPEWATGLIGAAFIGVAFINSLSYNRKNGNA